MAKLTFNSTSYEVDHAVKGADYIHGYNATGGLVVSFEGVRDFTKFTYSGTYMSPESCYEELCNEVLCVDGKLVRRDGAVVNAVHTLSDFGVKIPSNADLDEYTTPGDYYVANSSVAQTVSNSPITTSGYRLTVEYGNASSIIVQNVNGGRNHVRYTRVLYSGTWYPWAAEYNSNLLPSPAELGAVALDGSNKMTGDLEIAKASPTLRLTANAGRVTIITMGSSVMTIRNQLDADNRTTLQLGSENSSVASLLRLLTNKSGQPATYDVLHTGNLEELGIGSVTTGTYAGTNTETKSITVPSGTKLLMVKGEKVGTKCYSFTAFFHPGQTFGTIYEIIAAQDGDTVTSVSGRVAAIAFSGTTCTITGASSASALNNADTTYNWFAFT